MIVSNSSLQCRHGLIISCFQSQIFLSGTFSQIQQSWISATTRQKRNQHSLHPVRRSLSEVCFSQNDNLNNLIDNRNLTGLYKKDRNKSDCMDEACEAVELNWLLRKGVAVISNLQITDSQEYFQTILKAGGILDVVEKYPKDGQFVLHNRRDKRGGEHSGKVRYTEEGHPEIYVEWDEPYGGTCSDVFILSEDQRCLTVKTDMYINSKQKRVLYDTIYKKVQN